MCQVTYDASDDWERAVARSACESEAQCRPRTQTWSHRTWKLANEVYIDIDAAVLDLEAQVLPVRLGLVLADVERRQELGRDMQEGVESVRARDGGRGGAAEEPAVVRRLAQDARVVGRIDAGMGVREAALEFGGGGYGWGMGMGVDLFGSRRGE